MTIRAYNELYLNDAVICLANAFDYAVNTCGLSADRFGELLVRSDLAAEFERGNPAVVSGRSGAELVEDVLAETGEIVSKRNVGYTEGRTAEYWAGWALAQYQWATVKRFKDIFARVAPSEVVAMYPVYHEADISRFVEAMERRYNEVVTETKLHKIRKLRKMSQNELAEKSGVNLRSIQLYEQRVNDIDKAQAQTLYRLAVVLGCNVEDLLEKPI